LTVIPGAYSPSDILVTFRPGVTAAALPGTTLGQKLDLVPGLYEVMLTPKVTVAQALGEYRADPQVRSAEPDSLLKSSSVPNDPQFSSQWDLQNTGQNGGTPGADIHATQAWDVTTGSDHVLVAVMDTGIDYTQTDLYRNVWINQAEIPASRLKNLIDVDGDGLITFNDLNDPRNQGPGKIMDLTHHGRIDASDILAPMIKDAQGNDTGYGGWASGSTQDGDLSHPDDLIGWNAYNNTNNPFDDNAHGTHVAGTIGATGNDGVGIAGINWDIQLMPVKFLNANGQGTISQFIIGFNYAVAHGAMISNNSWTGAGNSQALYDAINNARSHGHIFVAAAGNDSANTDQAPAYPSSFPLDNVVSVAATDRNDNLASFSNYGPTTVDLGAPAVDITSTVPNNGYGSFTGTSQATPHVVGVLALVWGLHPSWNYQQVINQVYSTVDKVPSLAGKTVTGGVVDAAAAVGISARTQPPPTVSSTSVTGPAFNTLGTVRVTFSTAIDPMTFTLSAVILTDPNGQAIAINGIAGVAGSNNTQFDVSFPTQTIAGSYTLTLGSTIHDPSGNALTPFQTTFAISGNATYTSTNALRIPALGRAVSLLNVNQDLPITRVTVRLDITATNDSGLYIHLQAPDGTNIVLSNRRGGNGQNFTATYFDDQASTPISAGQAPFTGTYQSDVPLARLIGKNAKGTWKLWVEDRSVGDKGVLNGWSLILNTAPGAPGIASIRGRRRT
jgi:subtilisin family serine protease/subtilisin-like proprotein convertase family protein